MANFGFQRKDKLENENPLYAGKRNCLSCTTAIITSAIPLHRIGRRVGKMGRLLCHLWDRRHEEAGQIGRGVPRIKCKNAWVWKLVMLGGVS